MDHRRPIYLGRLGALLTLVVAILFIQFFTLPARPAASVQKAPAHDEVITLRWFMPWDEAQRQQIALPLIAAFEAQYPTLRIQLATKRENRAYTHALDIALSQGNPPDLFYLTTERAYALSLRSMLLPLDEWTATDALALTDFAEETLALYRNPGQTLHCLPADVATLAVFYNKELFDAAGVSYPQAPWRWEDFFATAQQLTHAAKGDEQPAVYGVDRFDDYWPLVIWTATGHNVFDDPFAPKHFLLEEEAAINALQWLADLSLVQGVMPSPAAEDAVAENQFLAGHAAMQITDHGQIPTYAEQATFPFDFVELPVGNFAANRSDGGCFAIARNTAHPEAAWEFLKFLAAPAGMGAQLLTAKQQMMPALQTLQASAAFHTPTGSPARNKAAFLPETAYRFSLYDPLHPIYQRWAAVVSATLPELWTGEQSAAEVVDTLAEEAEELLNNLAEGSEPGGGPTTPVRTPTSPLFLPRDYYVAPRGDDQSAGESPLAPFATLQQALTVVQPGDTIHLLPGDYVENVVSVVDGRADAPITITGPATAILHGAGDASAAFYLTHSYYTLVGFTLDGLYGDPSEEEGYTDQLLYVQGKQVRQGVTGLHVLNMTFQNAGGECLRLRYFAQKNEIAYSTFTACGLYDFEFAGDGKNGEAIYIGTSSTQWADDKNPTADADLSSDNWVHHNVLNTQGNECVEIKEGSSANLIEYNTCTGQLDPDSAGIGVRGDGNIIRYNSVYGNVGAGVRLGGHEVDGVQYGLQNEVYGNRFWQNVAGGVNLAVGPQAKICDNWLEQNWGKDSIGDAGEAYEPTQPCAE